MKSLYLTGTNESEPCRDCGYSVMRRDRDPEPEENCPWCGSETGFTKEEET